jgi:hypothetical protein
VDALVTVDERSVVVEVRARLQPGAAVQIEAVRTWVRALPADLPILLVMLGDALSARERQQIAGDHDGALRILQWDIDADKLVSELRRLVVGADSDLLVVPRQP